MKLRWTSEATSDLAGIGDYLRDRSPAAALRVRADILATLESASRFPFIGRVQTEPGVRKLVTSRYSYLIYYAVDERAGEIAVLNIRIPARQREHEDD